MKKTVIFWGFAGIFALLAAGVYLKSSGFQEVNDFLLANAEALTQDEKPEPPKIGWEIVGYVEQPPCYVAIGGPKPNDPPQLVKGRTPICNSVKDGGLPACPTCLLG